MDRSVAKQQKWYVTGNIARVTPFVYDLRCVRVYKLESSSLDEEEEMARCPHNVGSGNLLAAQIDVQRQGGTAEHITGLPRW
mmetsp:Transcript_43025/g.98122  ORF Transcript_43025/g.98122 Transcript_43025/m.98122 type:complete len:82 (-) Transcript_43025:47-292(-)